MVSGVCQSYLPSEPWTLLAWQLLTLQRPFDGPNLGALVMRIAKGQSDAAALSSCTHPPALQQVRAW